MNKIKLNLFALVTMAVAGSSLYAQSVEEGRKFYYYERYQSAKDQFEKVLASNPNDVDASYWLGQTLIDNNDSLAAKAVYQKALTTNANAPLLLVGMGEIELLEGKTNDARQRFETAISLTKGKDIGVFNAIGKANAYAAQGDANYALEKLNLATQVKKFNDANTYLLLGDAYRKLVDGGGAVTNYNKALVSDPKLAAAKHRIGKVYLTQNNKDYFLPAFEEAIQLDPNYAPAIYDLYTYWFERDINKSAGYFDKYLAVTDVKPSNEYDRISIIYARKAFQEAITAAQGKITADPNADPRYYKLIAYSYDELKDSVNAKNYLDQYFTKQKPDAFVPKDYVFRAQLFGKFPGNEDSSSAYFTKAIETDTVKANQLEYATAAANLMAQGKKFRRQIDWMTKLTVLKGDKLSELDYYNFSKAISDAITASTDTIQIMDLYPVGDSVTNAYITAFPDKPQGYSYRSLIAKKADKDTSKGLALVPIEQQNAFLQKNMTDAGKKTIFSNYYYQMLYYTEYAKGISRADGYKKAIEVAEKMIVLYPDAASQENQFAAKTKSQLQGALDKFQKSQAQQSKASSK